MENANKKLKILFIITKSNFGGAQRYVYDLATNIRNKGFEPSVAFGGNSQLKEKLEEAGIATISIPKLERDIGILKEFRVFFDLVKIIRGVQPDLVHLNSSKIGILGALACRLYNLPHALYTSRFTLHAKIIFTAHGWAFKEKRPVLFRKIIEYISWLTIALCHVTIVVSEDDRVKIANFIFVQSKIKLVRNGLKIPNFKTKLEARVLIQEKIGTPIDNALWVGTIAELHKNKGLEYAIAAIAELVLKDNTKKSSDDGPTYIIIGNGEERENLETVVKNENLTGKVFFTKEIPKAAELLKAFDIALIPSLKEGLPYVLLEAGAAGLPVIATNVGGIPEVIEDMKSGIVIKAKRSKEISDALTFLITHEDKRKEFGDRLEKTVAEKFTLERMIQETVVIYNSA